MKELSVRQMARLNGVSEQILWSYDKVELFSPIYRDRKNGYRYYDIYQSVQLDMIQHIKALGMSLRDIREQAKYSDPNMLRSILYRSLDAVDQKTQELMYRRGAIERTLESYEWYGSAPPGGTIVLKYILRRLTYMTDSGVNLYDYGIDVYEKILRELKKNLIVNQLPPACFYSAGTVTKKEALLAGRFCSTEIFVLVDRGLVKEGLITQTPASMYLYIYCNSFDKERDYIERLLEEIRAREYRVTGDHICEVAAGMPMDIQERGIFLQLQVPASLRAKDV